MSILTDDEIQHILDGVHSANRWTLVERTIAATVDKLAAGVSVEPIAYLAWRDGKPAWDREDCICEDAVYPTEAGDNCTSMPLYTHPAPDHAALLRQALEALRLPCDRWNKQQTLIVNDAIAAIERGFEMTQQREAFEAWAVSKGISIERDGIGGYDSHWTECALGGWQAALQSQCKRKDALLREALEALDTRCGTNADERGPSGVITKIKTELGESSNAGVDHE